LQAVRLTGVLASIPDIQVQFHRDKSNSVRLNARPRGLEAKALVDRHGIGRGVHEAAHVAFVALQSGDTLNQAREAALAVDSKFDFVSQWQAWISTCAISGAAITA
jgi:hypothetical protein